ncbi:MAG TPA: SRPBCC domain-containing protein [Acidimicrobiales bacterium]|nr:SRPBCC domain-containing protein [Acidimicrobiales bacterium]
MTSSKPSTEPSPSQSSPAPPVTASVRIAAPPDVVFPYFTDPALATRWIANAALLDARPGGVFSLDVRGNPARGEYLEVDPPRRVVFSWGIEGSEDLPPGTSTVEVVLEADGEDTVVTLTHRDLPTADFRRSHQAGWGEFLGILGGVARSAG